MKKNNKPYWILLNQKSIPFVEFTNGTVIQSLWACSNCGEVVTYCGEHCPNCKEKLETMRINLNNIENSSNEFDIAKNKNSYTSVCPFRKTDCVCDPGYIHFYYPEWYNELYRNISPEEAVKKECLKYYQQDEDECDWYDNEDK